MPAPSLHTLRQALLVIPVLCTPAIAQQTDGPIAVTIDASRPGAPISKYLYGGFIEHGGSLMYRTLWAELIDDRKFWFPINSAETKPAAAASASPMRAPLRRWKPVGPDTAVTLDTATPFVGKHSPKIALGTEPHGIRQSGIAFVKDKQYTGRIYLRGTPGTKVSVSLITGTDRQTVTVGPLTADYRKYPLTLKAKSDATDGAIEITASGTGDLHIGTVSLMPADNVQGFRPDTIALLRDLHAGMWRLPGGNFLSDWDWYYSIGDIDKRPPVFDYAWNAMQTNDLGLDELMTMCALLGVDPYISVNAGLGDAHSAAEEVEYVNGAASTHMGAQRAKNGHSQPYHVKFWNIGNEAYGTWQYGHTDIKYYTVKHNDFARAMRAIDPSITIIASGAMPDEMTVEGQPRKYGLKDPQGRFGDPVADWTGGLFARSIDNFDGIAEHWYARPGKRFDYEHAKTLTIDDAVEAGYVDVQETTLEAVRHPANRVRKKAEEWAEYVKLFPAINDKKIFLSIDEYGYGQSNLKNTLATGMILDEMFRHTGFMTMAAYTMSTSTIDVNPTSAAYNSRGLLYKMYREHFGTLPVTVSGTSPQPAPRYPPYGDQPAENSGSSTYPLDVMAALTEDQKYLTIAVVNATDQARTLNLAGQHLSGAVTAWQLTGNALDSENRLGQSAQVQVKEVTTGNSAQSLSSPAYTITIYRAAIAR